MICLVGESGTGKTSIEKYLCDQHGLKKVVSHTTRPMRKGEVNGDDYFFVSEETFAEMERNGEFAETTQFRDWHYGATIKELKGKDIFVIEPIGLRKLLDRKEELGLNLTPVRIRASERHRMMRMLERGDEVDEVIRRIHNDRETFKGVENLIFFNVFNQTMNYKLAADEVLAIHRMNK